MCRRLVLCAVVGLAFAPLEVGARAEAQQHVNQSSTQAFEFLSETVDIKRQVHVYLPPGYKKDGAERYPLIVALHGLGGKGGDFFKHGNLASQLDSMIAKKQIRPVIVAAPDGGNGYWTNHPPRGKGKLAPRWADYISKEVLREMSQRFRTMDTRSTRVIVGVSMGGYGALSIALQNPSLFGGAVSLSGAIFSTPPGCKGGEVVCKQRRSKKGEPARACTVKKPNCTTVGKMAKRKHYRDAWGNPPLLPHWQKISPMALLAELQPTGDVLPRLYLQCGMRDKRFHDFMEEAHRLLSGNDIDHVKKSIPGANHSWKTWNSETKHWLEWLENGWRKDDKKKRSSEKLPATPRNPDDEKTTPKYPTPSGSGGPTEKRP